MSTLTVVLGKEEFYAGETIEGQVLCNFSKEKFIKSISVTLKGEAFVRFSESARKHSKIRKSLFDTIYFSSELDFFNAKFDILLADNEDKPVRIPPGIHTYPFRFILPEDLPSSFTGIEFRVWYEAKASIIRDNQEPFDSITPFVVFHTIDLNTAEEDLRKEVIRTDEQMIGGCPKTNVVELKVTIPKIGYAVKELIPIKCQISNEGCINIRKVTATVKQVVEYSSENPIKVTKVVERTLATVQDKTTKRKKSNELDLKLQVGNPLKIPDLTNNTFIRVEYRLYIFAITPRGCKNLHISIPVTYGHIPLRDQNSEYIAPVFQIAPSDDDECLSVSPKKDDPPSYEEIAK